MKLFIWNHPYHVSYGGACLYIVAESLELARQQTQAKIQQYGKYTDGNDLNISEITKEEPTRILECPCAEIYHCEGEYECDSHTP